MRIVRIIRVIALLVAGVGFAKTAEGAEDPPIVLTWDAPTRADCPDAAYVVGEIQRYVGAAAARQGKPIQVKATVRSVGLDGWQLLLKTTDRAVDGERVFQDESCKAVADAAVVVLAWMIDPDAMANRPDSPPPEHRIQQPLPPPTVPVKVAVPERAAVRPFIAFGVAGDEGTLPWPALGADARGGASWKGFRLAAHSSYWPSRRKAVGTVSDGTTAGARFALWALSLEGCIDVLAMRSIDHLEISLCAGPEVDLIHAAGFGVSVPARASKAWLSLTAGFEGRVALSGALGLVLRAGGIVPTEREHFALRGVGEVYRPNVVAARGSVGIQLEL